MRVDELDINLDVFVGKTKKTVRKISCHAYDFRRHPDEDGWLYKFAIPGYLDDPKEMRARTMFGAMIEVISTFRSVLVMVSEDDPSVKFFLDLDGSLKSAHLVEIFGPLAPT